jgi:hypothetical protein
LLTLFHPFFHSLLLPSPSLFPPLQSHAFMQTQRMSVVYAKILVPGLERQVRCCSFEIPFCSILCMYC